MIKKLLPTKNAHTINYPHVQSEFEVQAWLYNALRTNGHDVRGEVPVYGLFGLRKTKVSCRFDLVIFKNKVPVVILEVKAKTVNHKNGIEATRQGRNYILFGIPVLMIYGMNDAIKVIEEIDVILLPKKSSKAAMNGVVNNYRHYCQTMKDNGLILKRNTPS